MRRRLRELRQYPSAIIGMTVIAMFVGLSIYAVIAIPYSEAVRLWTGGPGVWDYTPRRAAPLWYDYFTSDRRARTINVFLEDARVTSEPLEDGGERVEIVFPFEFNYDEFPKEISLFIWGTYETRTKPLHVSLRRPDGSTIVLDERNMARRGGYAYRISQDMTLRRELEMRAPHVGLLADDLADPVPLKGQYELVVESELAEGEEFDNARLVIYGQLHGVAGTDHRRRDLTVALLWGAPLGLLFGVVAAVGAQMSTFVLGGIGTWFGGVLDAVFQAITRVVIIIPILAFLIMIGHFYSRSLFVMLGFLILLNVFSGAMIMYRAMFLQAKEAPYIEAARAYGAGNFRIIFRYLLPRLAPILLPQLVMVIPSFVFLEASLAVLGLGDPILPTWGKVIFDARENGALYQGQFYWIVQPSVLLMMIGMGFAMLGFTLDRVFNPRLRGV